jgi:hypothetical protein
MILMLFWVLEPCSFDANVSQKHTAYIFRAEVLNLRTTAINPFSLFCLRCFVSKAGRLCGPQSGDASVGTSTDFVCRVKLLMHNQRLPSFLPLTSSRTGDRSLSCL